MNDWGDWLKMLRWRPSFSHFLDEQEMGNGFFGCAKNGKDVFLEARNWHIGLSHKRQGNALFVRSSRSSDPMNIRLVGFG